MDKINEYFKSKRISNSLLGLMTNPRFLKIKMENPDGEDDDKKHYRIGAALDCLLTSPERWEEDFEVVDVNRPFGLMGKFVDGLPAGIHKNSDRSKYQEAYDKSGYKMSMDKIIEKMWANEEIHQYYTATNGISDKSIISKDEAESVRKAYELLKANEFTHPYFWNDDPISKDILTQVPIYFTYMDEECKGLLDVIVVDHVNKTIQPVDLKTIGKSVYSFHESFLEYGYYRQCAFYTLALKSEESPVHRYIISGYEVLPFLFIVAETKVTSTHPAIIYETSAFDRRAGLEGGTVKGRYYKGINELIEGYKYHRDNNYWDLPLDLLQSKGRIKLNVFE